MRVLSPKECVSQALAQMVLDFRRWLTPETQLLSKWRTQTVAYAVAEGKLVNDFSKQLDSYRKKGGTLPILILSVQNIVGPPDLSQIMGTHFEVKHIFKNDPLKRRATMRTEPRAYHVQFVFVANDPTSADAFASQFCAYIRLMEKRRIKANYFVSPEIRDEWDLTIFDNTLYPDRADLEETNVTAGLVEFDLAGLVPQVKSGLPPLYVDEFTPEDEKTSEQFSLVIQADLFKDREGEKTFIRIDADPATDERTEQVVDKD